MTGASLDAGDPAPVTGSRFAVEATHIRKEYGPTTALDDVGIAIKEGDSHALVGRNGAGKSTLVSIITGLQAPDAGTVRFFGTPAPPLAHRDAWRGVVACVYQKSTIIPTLSVSENLFLNRQQTSRAGTIRWSVLRRQARDLLAEWDIRIDVDRPAAELNVEQRQMLEIARALSFGGRFVILDEPTAQLDSAGIQRLFGRLRDLQSRGVTLLYISHHLEEIYEVCQTVSVLRDARHILTARVADLPQRDLVAAMTGEVAASAVVTGSSEVQPGPPVLRVTGLTTRERFEDVSFEIRPGEVVGVTGSGSSGRLALAETIVGLRRAESGTVEVCGRRLRRGRVRSALDAGVGFVPRDRHQQGFVPGLGVAENVTMTITRQLSHRGLLSLRRRDQLADRFVHDLSIVASGTEQEVASLSGGNQQKVVMARALANDPRVLVLMHPTAGVDVRSKETLLDVVGTVRGAGAGVLIVSDELEDLRACDRVLVMRHGEVVAEFVRGWQSSDLIAEIEGIGAPSA